MGAFECFPVTRYVVIWSYLCHSPRLPLGGQPAFLFLLYHIYVFSFCSYADLGSKLFRIWIAECGYRLGKMSDASIKPWHESHSIPNSLVINIRNSILLKIKLIYGVSMCHVHPSFRFRTFR